MSTMHRHTFTFLGTTALPWTHTKYILRWHREYVIPFLYLFSKDVQFSSGSLRSQLKIFLNWNLMKAADWYTKNFKWQKIFSARNVLAWSLVQLSFGSASELKPGIISDDRSKQSFPYWIHPALQRAGKKYIDVQWGGNNYFKYVKSVNPWTNAWMYKQTHTSNVGKGESGG